MTDCKTCKLTAQRDAGTAPLWDCIHRTAHWDIVHSYNTSLLGWLVLVARTHRDSIDQLTEEERMLKDGAASYAQEKLQPRITDAYREETVAPEIFPEMGEMGLLGVTVEEGQSVEDAIEKKLEDEVGKRLKKLFD